MINTRKRKAEYLDSRNIYKSSKKPINMPLRNFADTSSKTPMIVSLEKRIEMMESQNAKLLDYINILSTEIKKNNLDVNYVKGKVDNFESLFLKEFSLVKTNERKATRSPTYIA